MFSFYTQTIIDMIPIWLAILLLTISLFRFATWAKIIIIWRDSMLKQNKRWHIDYKRLNELNNNRNEHRQRKSF